MDIAFHFNNDRRVLAGGAQLFLGMCIPDGFLRPPGASGTREVHLAYDTGKSIPARRLENWLARRFPPESPFHSVASGIGRRHNLEVNATEIAANLRGQYGCRVWRESIANSKLNSSTVYARVVKDLEPSFLLFSDKTDPSQRDVAAMRTLRRQMGSVNLKL